MEKIDKEFLQEFVHTLVEENTPLETLEEENIEAICSLYGAYLAEDWDEEQKTKEVEELLQEYGGPNPAANYIRKKSRNFSTRSSFRLNKKRMNKMRNSSSAKDTLKMAKIFGIPAALIATYIAPNLIGSAVGTAVAPVIQTGGALAGSAISAATSATITATPAVGGAATSVIGGALAGLGTAATAVGTYVLAPVVIIAGLLSLTLYVENLLTKKKFREAFLKQVKKCLGAKTFNQTQALLLTVKNSKAGEPIHEKAKESLDLIREELSNKNCKG